MTIEQATFDIMPELHDWMNTADASGCFSHIEARDRPTCSGECSQQAGWGGASGGAPGSGVGLDVALVGAGQSAQVLAATVVQLARAGLGAATQGTSASQLGVDLELAEVGWARGDGQVGEEGGWIPKDENGGRKITKEGQRELDTVAVQAQKAGCPGSAAEAGVSRAVPGPIQVRVLPNGGAGDGRLVEVPEAPTAGAALAAALCGHLPWAERGEEPFFVSERAVVFAPNRGNLDSAAMHAALQEEERLFVVPRHRQFVHPAGEPGRSVQLQVSGADGAPVVLTTLSSSPRVFHVSNLLEGEHMDRLMADARPKFKRSTVGEAPEAAKGIHVGGELFDKAAKTSTRTSENAWAMTGDAAMTMKRRSLEMLGIQTETGGYDERLADGLQVVRYLQGQAYHDHLDHMQDFDPLWNYNAWRPPDVNGSNRIATVFLYMTDTPLGGQTVFPLAQRVLTEGSRRMLTDNASRSGDELARAMEAALGGSGWEVSMARRCFEKLAVFPRRGDAIVFYSQHADGRVDQQSLHGGCPVLEGEKWAANLWVWNAPRKGTVAASNNELHLTFTLARGAGLAALVRWVPADGQQGNQVGKLQPGGPGVAVKTFESHRFDVFKASEDKDGEGDALRRLGTVVASTRRSRDEPHGPCPRRGRVQTWVVSDGGVELQGGSAEATVPAKPEL
ncbi:unnamed protein product [Prorocentrum cordatum]|uniref:Fe2OG dioxygenase domain-containing protein n=1 Tax=Prorocentrum cordatum TaxID=2364126 RepID=A0ABN9TTP0_9DINO|nr:unnamed protein product [Polarella glacialis]